jgi:hypothetical protein
MLRPDGQGNGSQRRFVVGDEREFLEQKIRLEIEFDNSSRLRFLLRASARRMSFLLGLHSVGE